MISKKPRGFLSKSMWIVTGVLFIGVTLGPRVAATATVSELVAQAKKEGALNATVSSAMKGTTIKKLTAGFKKRFGLNIKVHLVAIADTRYYPKALAATEAGAAPRYDSLEGSVLNQMIIKNAGGVQRVEGWKALLAEINPLVRSGKVRPAQISPEPFSGTAFHYMSRVKAMLYNTKVISRDKLPKTHAELGDPKYKDKFVQPPFTSHWDIGLLAFPEISKKKWLEVIGKAGKNSGAIGYPSGNLQRLLIGEYPFGLIQIDNYLAAKRKDPKVPLGFSYFKDYNGAPSTFYNVRKGAKHPAAGTLFALWVGSPDAKAIWQSDINGSQFEYGESEIDKQVKGYLDAQGATTFSYLGSKEGVELLKWMVTKEGRKYRAAISKAIRGGKGRKRR